MTYFKFVGNRKTMGHAWRCESTSSILRDLQSRAAAVNAEELFLLPSGELA
jgi:hypothetical protein